MTRSTSLAHALIYLDSELEDESIDLLCPSHLERLVDEFYIWANIVEHSMIELGLGDDYLKDIWPGVEFTYLCVRLGHGVGFADNFNSSDSVIMQLAKIATNAAKSQSYLEDGVYLGDDGIIYLYNYHSFPAFSIHG